MGNKHMRNIAPMQSAPRCGARTRSGDPCKSPCIAGAARCRMHGGKGSGAPHGNHNARKHGAHDKEMRERTTRIHALLGDVRRTVKRAVLN